MSTMAKDLFSTFPQKVSFGAQHGDNKKGTQHAAVESFSADSVASGGYRPRKQSVPLEQRPSMSLINRGLLNPTGQNNCFLNSAVQVSGTRIHGGISVQLVGAQTGAEREEREAQTEMV